MVRKKTKANNKYKVNMKNHLIIKSITKYTKTQDQNLNQEKEKHVEEMKKLKDKHKLDMNKRMSDLQKGIIVDEAKAYALNTKLKIMKQ